MAEKFNCLPSDIVGLISDYDRYCFDEAIFLFITRIEDELESIKEGKGKNAAEVRAKKQEKLLKDLLGIKEEDKKRFADPAAMLKGR